MGMEGKRGGEKERGGRDGAQVTTNRLVGARDDRMREGEGKGRKEGVGEGTNGESMKSHW